MKLDPIKQTEPDASHRWHVVVIARQSGGFVDKSCGPARLLRIGGTAWRPVGEPTRGVGRWRRWGMRCGRSTGPAGDPPGPFPCRGRHRVAPSVSRILGHGGTDQVTLPPVFLEVLAELHEALLHMEQRVAQDERVQLLMTIPGVGPMTATVALANHMARTAWAVLTSGQPVRENHVSA